MANRYQDRPLPGTDIYSREPQPQAKGDGDPLAELARLIGQTDPFAGNGRQAPRHASPETAYHDEQDDGPSDSAPPGPPPWMQRAAAHEAQQQTYEETQPMQHYAAEHPAQAYQPDHYDQHHDDAAAYASTAGHGSEDAYYEQSRAPVDPDRYDDALYGHAVDANAQQYPQSDPYADDPYGYQDGYASPEETPKRRGGMMTVGIVLALAVVGTGGAFAYRTFVGSTRSGEPPVIKAEPGPNKIIPPSATASNDAGGKAIQDRMGGNAPERLVSREEQPVNVQDNTKAGPRVVFPPLNQNANPPTTASVSPANKPMVGNGAMQGGDEPRKIRTFAVRGDQSDGSATPAARQAPARITAPAATPAANAPMSLSPQAPTAAPARVASTNPTQPATAASSNGGYVVQISSQRSESDAQASFRALQGKFPAVLGSRTPLIKRADLGDKGTYYRAMVGPFGSPDEAAQFCGNLKTAGGQCVVQRN